MKLRIKKSLTLLIGWPLSILALFFIVKTFLPKLQDVSHNIQHVNGWLLTIGVVCFLTYYLIRSLIWQRVLGLMGYKLPIAQTLYLWSSSEVKRYIPGNIWSFVGRSVSFTNIGVTKRDVAKAIILEQEFVLLGSFIVSALSLSFLAKYIFVFLQSVPYLWFLGVLLVIATIFLYMFLPKYLFRLPGRIQKILRHILPDFSLKDIFWLLFSSCLAFLFFGFGYYFTIAALHFSDPQLFFPLSGFFVFSLVVGLLSFLTPTGLGVREGIITIGLGKIIPLSTAGFASLFGRIVLIFSEIIFLGFTLGLVSFYKTSTSRVETMARNYRYEIVLGILIFIFIIFLTTISFLRYDNFYAGRFDLGNMDQTVWNTVHGRFFQLSDPNGTEIVSRLAFHSDYLLVALAPLYFIWQDPRMLLLIQVLVLAAGAIFVYLLAEEVLAKEIFANGKLLALAFAFCYLLNPSMERALIFDFHAVTFATTFLLAAFYFQYKKRFGWFLVFAFLAGITKEEVWLIVALLGLYIVVKNFKLVTVNSRQIIFGFFVFAFSSLIFYFLLWHAIPQAARGQHFALSYFSDGSDSPSALIKNVIFSPEKTIAKVLHPERVDYFRKLLGPLGYLSLASPFFLLFPGADLVLNILSDKGELHQIYYQYTAAITPFLFIAAIYGVRNILGLFELYVLKTRKTQHVSTIRKSENLNIRQSDTLSYLSFLNPIYLTNVCTLYIFIVTIVGAYLYGPLPGAKEPNIAMFTRQVQNKAFINTSLAQIDTQYSVAASNSLGAHLSQREHIYTLPLGLERADVVAFLLSDSNNMPSQEWHREASEKLRKDQRYSIWFEKGDFIVFRRLNK
jgi:uncharacterized membrane protein/uncharacterized membrane protein YbhN (UPF0104 family)